VDESTVDIREVVFSRVRDKEITAQIIAETNGIIAGSKNAQKN